MVVSHHKDTPKILLVDDRPENLSALEGVLEPLGMDLVAADSGEEALKRLLKDDFSLVLLDVQMPSVDGFETAEHMRELEKTRDIPVIFVTAFNKDIEAQARGFSLGAFDYVVKPFEPDVLRSKVNVLVDLYGKKMELKQQARALEERLEEQTRLNRALDDFSGWVAHDLRSPLAVVSGAIEALRATKDVADEKYQTFIELAMKGIRTANTLIDGLLELAKASGTPRPEPIDVAALIQEASAGIDGIEIETGQLVPEIRADRTAVCQALTNLLINARKYARHDGKVIVTISVTARPDGWTFCVADRGPGLSESEEAEVFERYRRGDLKRSKGTGLGLAIVAATAEAHGGRAWYEPRPGGGACFFMSIAQVAEPSG